MLTDDGARLVDDPARCLAQALGEESLVPPSAIKQTSWLSGLSATATPHGSSRLPSTREDSRPRELAGSVTPMTSRAAR
jgi:hypothetical protein